MDWQHIWQGPGLVLVSIVYPPTCLSQCLDEPNSPSIQGPGRCTQKDLTETNVVKDYSECGRVKGSSDNKGPMDEQQLETITASRPEKKRVRVFRKHRENSDLKKGALLWP